MPNTPLLFNAATLDPPIIVDGFIDDPGTHILETSTGGEPLEDGAQVTDHAISLQEKVTLTGFISDFDGAERPGEGWERLRSLHKAVTPITVTTAWGTYPEMLIRRAEGRPIGRGIEFTLELEQVIRVGVTDNELPSENLDGPAEERSGEVERGRVPIQPIQQRELRPEDVSG